MKEIFVSLLKPYKKQLISSAFFELARGICLVISTWAMTKAVDGVFLQGEAMPAAAPYLGVLLFALSLSAILFGIIEERLCAISTELREQLRIELHHSLLQKPSPTLESHMGDLLTLTGESIDAIDEIFRQVLPTMLGIAMHTPLFLIVMFTVDLSTALLFLISFPIAPVLLSLIGGQTKKASKAQWQKLIDLNFEFSELLSNLLTLKIFRRVKAQEERLARLSEEFSAASLAVLRIAFLSTFALELITTIAIALISVWAGTRLLYGHIEFDAAFFTLLLAPLFFAPLRASGLAFHAGMTAGTAMERLAPYRIEGNAPQKERQEQISLPPSIEAKSLSFRYDGRIDRTISDLSFFIPAGSTTVLTGESGTGKSTLLKLMARLLSPEDGNLLLGGHELAKIHAGNLPRLIAYVPQEPHIFSASLRENIALRPLEINAEEDAKIRHALHAAALSAWLQDLPRGLDTMLGAGARSLSLGQRHRLGLARAIYQNASCILLDEITAGLDDAAEEEILKALDELSYHRTIVLAAHRPRTIAWAKNIWHLEDGNLTIRNENGKERTI